MLSPDPSVESPRRPALHRGGGLQSSVLRFLRAHPLLAVTAVAALYHLVRLGSTDLHEWDEAIYSVRTLAILQRGEWLDQTAGSIGGLWSAAHPPFAIWMMAFAVKLLGLGEWSLRLPSALCGIGCVAALYGLARELGRGRDLVPATAVGLVLLPYFTRFARMAQLDAPVLFWMLCGFYAFWRAGSGRSAWFAAAGAALGLGLLTKIAVALFVPLSIGLFIALQLVRRDTSPATIRRDAVGLFVTVAIGLVIAAPWFVAMAARHGAPFWDRYLGYHVLTRIAQPLEGHGSPLGVLFYVQQILKVFGVLVPLVILGTHAVHRRQGLSPRAGRFLLAWCEVPFVVFSMAATKLGIYALLFIAPLVLYAAVGLRLLTASGASPRARAAVLPLAIAALVYAQTNPLQRGLERWAEALRALALPTAGDALRLTAFTAGTVFATALCAWWYTRLGAHGRAVWRRTTWVVLVLGLVVPAVEPLLRTRSSWIRTQATLRAADPMRVILVGEASAVNRYYLQSARRDGGLDWSIVAPAGFDAGDAARTRVPGAILVVQRGMPGTPRAPAGFVRRLATAELDVYTPALGQRF